MHHLTPKCKWCGIFVVLMISVALYYDTQINGQGIFAESATGKALKDAGVLPLLQKGCDVALVAGARGFQCYEKYVDPYVVIVSQMVEDLVRQSLSDAGNVYDWAKGYFNQSWTLQVDVVDQYAPNLSKKLKAFASGAMESYNETATILDNNFHQMIIFAWKCNREFHEKVDEYAKRQLF
ncbi:uncharacterized protein [Drosophila pseudoobscura]|uniref:MICOS complex subunit MIC13 n=1 Tax=Drosophila pseudoobscura pseudoobscura TaxID=46245 RepID=A0A6I8VXC8_DROPS|nr:uncharacterized protein LOC117184004 [Drosophila pseudoobscura]